MAFAFSIYTQLRKFHCISKVDQHPYRLRLEGFNRLHVRADIVCHRLEGLQDLLSLIDDVLVLENSAVVCEVEFGGLRFQRGGNTLGVAVTLPKSLERGNSLCRCHVEIW